MSARLTADDLWPLVQKLTHEEQVKLAKRALMAPVLAGGDASAYRAVPPAPGEFSSDDDALAWDAEGWEKLDAAR